MNKICTCTLYVLRAEEMTSTSSIGKTAISVKTFETAYPGTNCNRANKKIQIKKAKLTKQKKSKKMKKLKNTQLRKLQFILL